MTLHQAIDSIFQDMRQYLDALDDHRYAMPLEVLSQASAGQHTRHVIEFFQCLLEQSEAGQINYDKRIRNQGIQEHCAVALEALNRIAISMESLDLQQPLRLEVAYDAACEAGFCVDSTMERELVYNIEHAIHHLAMIKIGLRINAPEIVLRPGFGVAPSTVRFQEQGR